MKRYVTPYSTRYTIHYGMNPVSAMCYRIWDNQDKNYVKYPDHKYSWEFLTQREAEKEIRKLEGIL